MPLPTIETKRLLLREASAANIDELRAIWDHEEVRRYLFDDEAVTRERAAGVLEASDALLPRGLGVWILEPKGEGRTIGCVGLMPTSMTSEYDSSLEGLVEPVVALERSQWGRGLSTEALRAALAYAFETLKLPVLAGVTDVPNLNSDRMLRAVGFVVDKECPGPKYRMRTYRLTPRDFRGEPAS